MTAFSPSAVREDDPSRASTASPRPDGVVALPPTFTICAAIRAARRDASPELLSQIVGLLREHQTSGVAAAGVVADWIENRLSRRGSV